MENIIIDCNYRQTMKNLRKSRNITLIEMSKLCNQNISNLSRFEKDLKDINLSSFIKMCDALGFQIELRDKTTAPKTNGADVER